MLSEGARIHIGTAASSMSVTGKVKKIDAVTSVRKKTLKLLEASARKDRQVMPS